VDGNPEVVTLGHAIVDVLAPSEDELVAGFGLEKGTMTLIDDARAEKIYASLGPATEVSGGSAANTAACLASLGAPAAFIGKVRDDTLGRFFTHDIRAAGVQYRIAPFAEGPSTGCCLIMVTPDAEKTMCTNLGIGALLGPDEVDAAAIAAARVMYMEGYLYGDRPTDATVERAIELARDAGTEIALSLSDPNWVELHGAELESLLDHVDLLFANEQEACGIVGAADLDAALAVLAKRCSTVAVTRGGQGSVVVTNGHVISVPAAPVEHVVDTTGAGDSYAAGFLYGFIMDLGPQRCARLGGLAAAEIVGHLGARPQQSLATWVNTRI
jgi:sugar/nucleoside kinase (ribokinase family)